MSIAQTKRLDHFAADKAVLPPNTDLLVSLAKQTGDFGPLLESFAAVCRERDQLEGQLDAARTRIAALDSAQTPLLKELRQLKLKNRLQDNQEGSDA